MIEFSADFMRGVMVGIEFPPSRLIHEDMSFSVVVNLFILRLTMVVWERDD